MSLLSCKKALQANNQITKIELARSGAWSDPGAVISIDSTLNYEYYGLLDSSGLKQPRKYYTGKVNKGFWDTLNSKFNKINFKALKGIDSETIVDANYFELVIHWNNGKVRVTRVYTVGKDSVINTIVWLNNSFKNIKLQQVKGPFRFETVLQNPPPHPNIKQIKFPPPIKQ